mgnify:CR=1 FL=1
MKPKFTMILMLMALGVQLVFAQQKTVSGTVSDENGLPLPGATVIRAGTSSGTSTDFDGKYQLRANSGDVLEISYVGYTTQSITVGSANTYNVSLTLDNTLDEVVVTALGRSKEKEKLGYAFSELKAEELEKSTDPNIVNALAGKVTGVSITNSSGDVGASSNIVIRGTSSISGNNQALFVVDGVPIDNQTLSTGRGSYGTNRAGDIDMSNVESISVLKGGAATVLYGERAANGVVLITTKRGKDTGKLNVELKTGYTIGEPNKFHPIIHNYSRGRFGDFSAVTHWNWGPAYSTNPTFQNGTNIDQNGTGTRTDVSGQAVPLFKNNYKNFFVNSHAITHNISVNGANEKGRFNVAFSKNKSDGVVRNSEYARHNFSVNGDYDVNEKLNFGASVQYIDSDRKSTPGLNGGAGWGSGLIYYHHMWDLVNRNWKDASGRKTWFSGAVVDPMWSVNETNENNKVNRMLGNVNATYKFTDLFNVSYRIGVDNYSDVRKRMRPVSDISTTGRLGDMYDWRAIVTQINSDLLISGAYDLNDDIELSYLVGGNINERKYDRIQVTGKEQVLPRYTNITNYVNFETTAYKSNQRTMGVFGELTLDYKGYLLLTGTARNDWSSTLPADNRSFFYPSISTGFIFSKLMENNNVLNFGKIRASWAKVGKSAPLYSLYDTYDKISTNALGQPRAEVSDLQKNPNLKPEISSEYEIGTELKFFDSKVNLDVTYYNKKTVDQHVRIPLTNTSGYNQVITNAGTVRNKGIEALLTLRNLATFKDFNWDLGFNFTKNDNVVEELPDGIEQITLASGWWSNTSLVARKGMSTGTIVGTAYKRDDKGNILTNNGKPIRDEENQVIGNTIPDYILGVTSNLNYKGFGLSFLFEHRKGGDVINDAKAGFVYSGIHKVTENRWYPSANDANVGRPSANATTIIKGIDEASGKSNTTPINLTNDYWANDYRRVGENFVEDASWLRLRNVTLSYIIPKKYTEKIGFSNIKLSLTGTNLWLKTDYSGHDPETSGFGAGNFQGYDILSAPSTKSYSFNVKLNF